MVMDLISLLFGAGLTFLILFIYGMYLSYKKNQVKPIELNGTFERKPFCPECGCYDLKLINIKPAWLQNTGNEIDYYECQGCKNIFNDENWNKAL